MCCQGWRGMENCTSTRHYHLAWGLHLSYLQPWKMVFCEKWDGTVLWRCCINSNLHWWQVFLEDWNGVSIINSVVYTPPLATITSDALGGRGLWSIFLSRWIVGGSVCSVGTSLETENCLLLLWQCSNCSYYLIMFLKESSGDAMSALFQLVLVPQHLPGKGNIAMPIQNQAWFRTG